MNDILDNRPLALILVAVLCALTLGAGIRTAFAPSPSRSEDPQLWSHYGPSWGYTSSELFRIPPRQNAQLLDEELYLGTLQHVSHGDGYYAAAHEMFMQNAGRWNTKSPLTFRQPLLTHGWAALNDGASICIAWSVLAAGAIFASFAFARRLVRPMIAVLAPFGLALVFILLITHLPRILYAEAWAAPFAVIAGALCGLTLGGVGTLDSRRLWTYSAGGAVCILLAMLVRELALAPACVMLFALLLDSRVRARYLWIPWIGSVATWIGAYQWHILQVRAVSVADPVVASATTIADFVTPGIGFIAACVRWVSVSPAFLLPILILCGMAALSPLSVRTLPLRALAGGLSVGSILVLVVVGTPGTFPDGSFTGYWGFFFLPLAIAWAPVCLRLFVSCRPRPGTPPLTGTATQELGT